jgi:hypothetical protein
MSNEREAEIDNFLGTCMDLVFGVINTVKKCLNATIYSSISTFRITIGRVENVNAQTPGLRFTCTNTQSSLLISKSYHQPLLSGIFLSVNTY